MPRIATDETLFTESARKRDFESTEEPTPCHRKTGRKLRFVIQKHEASRLHHDLRLELHGVRKIWAVSEGLGSDIGVRRLAISVEDHPLDYRCFEGTIPKSQRGGGTVMV